MSTFSAFSAPHLFFPCPTTTEPVSPLFSDYVSITETQACELRFLLEDLEFYFSGTTTAERTGIPGAISTEFVETMTMSAGASGATSWEVRGDAGDISSSGAGSYPRVPVERVCKTDESGNFESPAFYMQYAASKTRPGELSEPELGLFYFAIRRVSGSLRLYYSINGSISRNDGIRPTPQTEIVNPARGSFLAPFVLHSSGSVSIAGVSINWEAYIPPDDATDTFTLTGANMSVSDSYYTPV